MMMKKIMFIIIIQTQKPNSYDMMVYALKPHVHYRFAFHDALQKKGNHGSSFSAHNDNFATTRTFKPQDDVGSTSTHLHF
jgi:hypothetical protein